MKLKTDFKELLALFNPHGVEYLIVGAYALAHHGVPRYTRDLNMLVRPTNDNASRVMDSLQQFGFGEIGLKHEDFTKANAVVQLGVPPIRIDVITSISSVSWDEANGGRVEGAYGDVPTVFWIGNNSSETSVLPDARRTSRIWKHLVRNDGRQERGQVTLVQEFDSSLSFPAGDTQIDVP